MLQANESDPSQIGYHLISIQIWLTDPRLQQCDNMIPQGEMSFSSVFTALSILKSRCDTACQPPKREYRLFASFA